MRWRGAETDINTWRATPPIILRRLFYGGAVLRRLIMLLIADARR